MNGEQKLIGVRTYTHTPILTHKSSHTHTHIISFHFISFISTITTNEIYKFFVYLQNWYKNILRSTIEKFTVLHMDNTVKYDYFKTCKRKIKVVLWRKPRNNACKLGSLTIYLSIVK